jgi:transcriptional regulator with XRE-family HTH domain
MRKPVLYNRFRELLAIKGRREGRKISQQEVAEEIGSAINTVNAIAQNKPSAYLHRETIEKMLNYFGVTHAEFFETVYEDDDTPEMESPLAAEVA